MKTLEQRVAELILEDAPVLEYLALGDKEPVQIAYDKAAWAQHYISTLRPYELLFYVSRAFDELLAEAIAEAMGNVLRDLERMKDDGK